jgi:hypothetical protein
VELTHQLRYKVVSLLAVALPPTTSSTFAAEDAFDQTSQLIRTMVHGYFALFESNISATKHIESVSSIFGSRKKVCTIRRERDHNEKACYYVKL